MHFPLRVTPTDIKTVFLSIDKCVLLTLLDSAKLIGCPWSDHNSAYTYSPLTNNKFCVNRVGNETIALSAMSTGQEPVELEGDVSAVIPKSARYYLYFVAAAFVLLLILLLYLEKVLCFRICQGRTCFDPMRTSKCSNCSTFTLTLLIGNWTFYD
ncbi:unnamed protein product [Dibothriocephalus latus]|uniref:Uncharacterized protein n=1 Tax=Dibothriocephalus latus TaxID=60516 RepID=A0A3P7PB22_DIBLA|nr:unnamed protein product [Dibothriocephalus latus]